MLDKISSLRLDVLRFPLIVGVVFIHAYGANIKLADQQMGSTQPAAIYDMVTQMVSQGVARIAVPLFFLISAYLFFLHWQPSAQTYRHKLKSRIPTLLIPYLLWNIVTFGVFALGQALPATAGMFSSRLGPISQFSPGDYAVHLLGLSPATKGQPIAYQFWFIRDLMLLALLAPLLHAVLRRAAWPVLTLLLICWGANQSLLLPRTEGVLFFALGAWAAMQQRSLFELDRFGPAALAAYGPLLLADVLLAGHPLHWPLHCLGMLTGIIAALWGSRFLATHARLAPALVALGGASFFVYAAHEPLLTALKKLAFIALQPSSTAAALLIYFLVPLLSILLCLLAYAGLARWFPRLTSLLTGGRAATARRPAPPPAVGMQA